MGVVPSVRIRVMPMVVAGSGGPVADAVMMRGIWGGDGGEVTGLSGLLLLLVLLLLMAHVDGCEGLLHVGCCTRMPHGP